MTHFGIFQNIITFKDLLICFVPIALQPEFYLLLCKGVLRQIVKRCLILRYIITLCHDLHALYSQETTIKIGTEQFGIYPVQCPPESTDLRKYRSSAIRSDGWMSNQLLQAVHISSPTTILLVCLNICFMIIRLMVKMMRKRIMRKTSRTDIPYPVPS